MLSSVFVYASDCWAIKKNGFCRIDEFEMACWKSMFRILSIAGRTNQSIQTQLIIKDQLTTTIKC